MEEGKKAAKPRTNRDRLEFTLVDQTVRRFVRPDDLFVFWCENGLYNKV